MRPGLTTGTLGPSIVSLNTNINPPPPPGVRLCPAMEREQLIACASTQTGSKRTQSSLFIKHYKHAALSRALSLSCTSLRLVLSVSLRLVLSCMLYGVQQCILDMWMLICVHVSWPRRSTCMDPSPRRRPTTGCNGRAASHRKMQDASAHQMHPSAAVADPCPIRSGR